MKKFFVTVLLIILGTTVISTAQDTTDPLADFFRNLGFTVEESAAPTTETATGETSSEPPYESSLEPPYCNEAGTDGFAPCGSRYDNECNDGGELEGKCDTSDLNLDGVVEDWEIVYMWDFGWALARYNQGLISREDFPFQSMLPPLPGESANGGEGICYDSASPFAGDFSYLGPTNVVRNALFWGSTDGSCSPTSGFPVAYVGTVVTAPNETEARQICINLGIDRGGVTNLSSYREFTTADPNWWTCDPAI